MFAPGSGRRCVVTGPSRGIGKAVAELLATTGYDVVGLSRQRPDWWRGDYIECDLADRASLAAGAETIRSMPGLWALVNNAAVPAADQIGTLSVEGLTATYMVNAIAPAILTQAAAERFDGGGRIVNLCSNVMLGHPNRTAYAASKAALAAMTRVWALELGPRGITVNAIAPGPIDTDMLRLKVPYGSDRERALLGRIPVGQLGRPEEVAHFVGHLLAAEAGYCTGQTIFVDGGYSISAPR
jgi:3-oxoacyl-[acyl-carrier protein] reductase